MYRVSLAASISEQQQLRMHDARAYDRQRQSRAYSVVHTQIAYPASSLRTVSAMTVSYSVQKRACAFEPYQAMPGPKVPRVDQAHLRIPSCDELDEHIDACERILRTGHSLTPDDGSAEEPAPALPLASLATVTGIAGDADPTVTEVKEQLHTMNIGWRWPAQEPKPLEKDVRSSVITLPITCLEIFNDGTPFQVAMNKVYGSIAKNIRWIGPHTSKGKGSRGENDAEVRFRSFFIVCAPGPVSVDVRRTAYLRYGFIPSVRTGQAACRGVRSATTISQVERACGHGRR